MTVRLDLGLDPRRPMVSGDTFAIAATLVVDDDGTPQDLTGASATYAVFDLDPDTGASITEQFSKTIGSGITITSAAAGLLTITVLASNTAPLDGDYFHELQVTIGSTTQTPFFGALRLRKDGIT